jgi:hypothetical protein
MQNLSPLGCTVPRIFRKQLFTRKIQIFKGSGLNHVAKEHPCSNENIITLSWRLLHDVQIRGIEA